MRNADLLGAFICWLFNRIRGKKVSLKEELSHTFATRHLVVGCLAGLVFTILLVLIFSFIE
jgi:hypothetical protein